MNHRFTSPLEIRHGSLGWSKKIPSIEKNRHQRHHPSEQSHEAVLTKENDIYLTCSLRLYYLLRDAYHIYHSMVVKYLPLKILNLKEEETNVHTSVLIL